MELQTIFYAVAIVWFGLVILLLINLLKVVWKVQHLLTTMQEKLKKTEDYQLKKFVAPAILSFAVRSVIKWFKRR